MENVIQSIQVSFLAMGVIFLVLGLLIGVIRVLVNFLPHTEPPPSPQKASAPVAASPSSEDEDHIAAIHAVLAHHLGKTPQDLHIANITSR